MTYADLAPLVELLAGSLVVIVFALGYIAGCLP